MGALGYVLILVGILNLLHGVPALVFGHAGHLHAVHGPSSPADLGPVLGALATLIGLVRVLSGWALLKQRGVDRELYVLAALSFAVEIARDAQMGRLAAGLDSVALGISSALLLWMSVAAKTHVRTSV